MGLVCFVLCLLAADRLADAAQAPEADEDEIENGIEIGWTCAYLQGTARWRRPDQGGGGGGGDIGVNFFLGGGLVEWQAIVER